MVETFVRLSDAESPESSEAERSGALDTSGAVKSTSIVVPALAADVLPAESTTTYVNTSQTAFEDELLSLGATDGRSVSSVSGAVVT